MARAHLPLPFSSTQEVGRIVMGLYGNVVPKVRVPPRSDAIL